jgi:NADPH2:quinone reductase
VTIGRDLAGVVEQVGEDVSRYQVGDEVFGFLGFKAEPVSHEGSFADYVASPEDIFVAPKPPSLDFLEAGALPLAGVAALMSIDVLDPSEGERVLIVGATGGVGSYAMQLAARRWRARDRHRLARG